MTFAENCIDSYYDLVIFKFTVISYFIYFSRSKNRKKSGFDRPHPSFKVLILCRSHDIMRWKFFIIIDYNATMYHTTPADPEKKVGMGVLMYLDIVIVLPTWYKINTFVTYLPHQKIAKMEALEHQILELPYHQGKGSCTIHSLKTTRQLQYSSLDICKSSWEKPTACGPGQCTFSCRHQFIWQRKRDMNVMTSQHSKSFCWLLSWQVLQEKSKQIAKMFSVYLYFKVRFDCHANFISSLFQIFLQWTYGKMPQNLQN